MLPHPEFYHLFQQDDSGHNSGAQQGYFFTWGFPQPIPGQTVPLQRDGVVNTRLLAWRRRRSVRMPHAHARPGRFHSATCLRATAATRVPVEEEA